MTKIFLIKSIYKFKKREINEKIKQLSKELKKRQIKSIGLLYTINFFDFVRQSKNILKQNFKLVYESQITGCSFGSLPKTKVDAFVYIGDGLFHPLNFVKEQINLVFEREKIFPTTNQLEKIYLFNPFSPSFSELSKKEIEAQINALKARWFNFNNAKVYGIVTSIKPGQIDLEKAVAIKKVLEQEKKRAFLFLGDNLSLEEFQNFNIDFWILVACPGLGIEGKKLCTSREFFIFEKLRKAERQFKGLSLSEDSTKHRSALV